MEVVVVMVVVAVVEHLWRSVVVRWWGLVLVAMVVEAVMGVVVVGSVVEAATASGAVTAGVQ